MNDRNFLNALNYLDEDLVEEYVNEREILEKKAKRRRAFFRYAPFAACFVILLCVGTLALVNGWIDFPSNSNGDAMPPNAGDGEHNGVPPESSGSFGYPPGTSGTVQNGIAFVFEGKYYIAKLNAENTVDGSDVGDLIGIARSPEGFSDVQAEYSIYSHKTLDSVIVIEINGRYYAVETKIKEKSYETY